MRTPSLESTRIARLCGAFLLSAGLATGAVACSGIIGGPTASGTDAGGGGSDPGPVDVPDAGTCAQVQVDLHDVIPTVMLLVDRSGTMKEDFQNTSRWNAVYQTLMDGQNGLVAQLQNQVRFGIATFSGYYGTTEGYACPIVTQVAPAMGNYGAINQMYAPQDPIKDTPTAPSLAMAQATLAGVTEPGPKIIVLATDGLPDTCDQWDPDGTTKAKADAIAAAQTAHTAGIDTYIISVGPDVAQSHLQDMANAGLGLPVGGAQNAPYYQALSPDSLVSAFNSIIGGVRSCTFSMDGQVDPSRASTGTVTLDGQPLTYGTDWQLVDESTLQLLGSACDTIMAGGDHSVTASFECNAVNVPD